jgi:hypothetical protein
MKSQLWREAIQSKRAIEVFNDAGLGADQE